MTAIQLEYDGHHFLKIKWCDALMSLKFCSRIFMNLVTSMHWGGQGVVEAVFSTQRRLMIMLLLLTLRMGQIQVHHFKGSQLAPLVLKLYAQTVQEILIQEATWMKSKGQWSKAYVKYGHTTTTLVASNSSLASNCHLFIPNQAGGWKKGTAWDNSMVASLWISLQTGLSPSSDHPLPVSMASVSRILSQFWYRRVNNSLTHYVGGTLERGFSTCSTHWIRRRLESKLEAWGQFERNVIGRSDVQGNSFLALSFCLFSFLYLLVLWCGRKHAKEGTAV